MLVLDHHGLERRPLGDRYRCDVRRRGPKGSWLLQLQVSGRIEHVDGGTLRVLDPGDLFITRFGSRCRYGFLNACRGPAAVRWVVIRGAHADPLLAPIAQAGGVFAPPGEACATWFDRLIEGASRERSVDPIAAAGCIYTALLRLGGLLGIASSADVDDRSSATADAMRLLVANPLHPWSLAELAARCGCTRDHLCRRFKALHGEAPQAWLHRRRLAAAEELLTTTRMSVAAIADQCGFGEAQALARHLRRAHGVGPRAFRNHQR